MTCWYRWTMRRSDQPMTAMTVFAVVAGLLLGLGVGTPAIAGYAGAVTAKAAIDETRRTTATPRLLRYFGPYGNRSTTSTFYDVYFEVDATWADHCVQNADSPPGTARPFPAPTC